MREGKEFPFRNKFSFKQKLPVNITGQFWDIAVWAGDLWGHFPHLTAFPQPCPSSLLVPKGREYSGNSCDISNISSREGTVVDPAWQGVATLLNKALRCRTETQNQKQTPSHSSQHNILHRLGSLN